MVRAFESPEAMFSAIRSPHRPKRAMRRAGGQRRRPAGLAQMRIVGLVVHRIYRPKGG